jgi:hypothetical protein
LIVNYLTLLEINQIRYARMKVNYKTIKNEKYSVTIPDDSEVQTLRQAIATDRSAKPELIRIIFLGKALSDGKPLSEYKIVDDSTVIIIINTKPISVKEAPLVPNVPPASAPIDPSGPPQPIIPPLGNLFGEAPQSTMLPLGNLFGPPSNTPADGDSEDLGSLLNGLGSNQLLTMMLLGSMMNDPETRPLIEANPGLALQMLSNPEFLNQIIGSAQEPTPLTEEEQAEVQELVEMGIPQKEAEECYHMANKNKMLAANIFFNGN